MDRLLLVLFSPLIFWQAKKLRKTATRLSEPAGERQGIRGDGDELSLFIIGDSAAAGVGVTTQDQALSGQLVKQLASKYKVRWKLHAKNGANTSNTIDSLVKLAEKTIATDGIEYTARKSEETGSNQFDVALISLGVNDVTSFISKRTWKVQLEHLVNLLKDRFGCKHIIFSALPPMGSFPLLPQPLRAVMGFRARMFNTVMEKYCEQLNISNSISYLDFAKTKKLNLEDIASDGFHPSKSTYGYWAERAAQIIIEKSC
ncbi:SGNH/GDSL hydrolase family protein [Thalassotalea crassostreae]|uniref:SGNH/GDSL hydrolase family protein n=1 Tax=Thalassotalea crassostreae TaxID=1763536 RepID=UPI000838DA90|nr:SGNH/GDSL hydrolase family protein [Thalassotalea crassostreae]